MFPELLFFGGSWGLGWGWREGSPTCICTRGVLMAGEGPSRWATADPESQAWPFVSPVESFFLSALWPTDSYSLCQGPRCCPGSRLAGLGRVVENYLSRLPGVPLGG